MGPLLPLAAAGLLALFAYKRTHITVKGASGKTWKLHVLRTTTNFLGKRKVIEVSTQAGQPVLQFFTYKPGPNLSVVTTALPPTSDATTIVKDLGLTVLGANQGSSDQTINGTSYRLINLGPTINGALLMQVSILSGTTITPLIRVAQTNPQDPSTRRVVDTAELTLTPAIAKAMADLNIPPAML